MYYYGFEIDGNRRFLLGDFTVTHNTVISLYLLSILRKKTIIIVHKEFLMEQWRERIQQFLPDARVGIIQQKKHGDKRGNLRETFIKKIIKWDDLIFDYATTSKKNVLRGFHFQSKYKQAKFVSVIKGKILDCVIDLRKNSKTFGKSFKIELSDKNCKSLYIPEGFAHAYYSYEKLNIVYYKLTNSWKIVAKRVKRSEGLFFKLCYQFHKFLTLAFTGQSIKFGNFTCLSKSTIEKMLKEKATWNSFSGSLKKIEKNLLSIPSIRGTRYFGPSKMSFFNLLKHSFSIISVYRKTVLIRSALFIVFYILLIKSLALRENMSEFENSLENINDIDIIK